MAYSKAELIKKNQDLQEKIKELSKMNIELTTALEKVAKQGKDKKSLRFKMVTVLYADVKGFTKLTEHANAENLIDDLDQFFLQLDGIVKKFNIEKTNSIGDTYMCAGGIPKKNRTNPIEVVLAAFEMHKHMERLKTESRLQKKKIWDLSLGIHTGPVTASSVGKKRISYEIKGDTVNIASRIESSSQLGKVTISDMSYELVQEFFRCEYIGKIPVKYIGDVAMYTVKGFRPEYSYKGLGVLPNKQFKIKFQLIKFDDLEELILDKLEKELPSHLYYHNLKHTIDVCNEAEVLGRGENVSEEDMLLLKTAALFHDAGHTIKSVDHEFHGTQIVNEMLPGFGYSDMQIEIINGIIMATKLPPKPKTKLQRIICDADLDYLGRSDFIPVSDTLYKELYEQKIIGESINEWNKMQLGFISSHQYFTKTATRLREVNKQKQIDRIRKLINK